MGKKSNNKLITAIVLSGGQSRRMGGGEKAVIDFVGQPMISYIINTLSSIDHQVDKVLINSNSPANYGQFNLPVLSDNCEINMGPLAGIEAGLTAIDEGYLLIVPCDVPLVTEEPIKRLIESVDENGVNCAVLHDGERMQTTFAIFHHSYKASLQAYLKQGGRRLVTWYVEQGIAKVDCSDLRHQFININTAMDLEKAKHFKKAD